MKLYLEEKKRSEDLAQMLGEEKAKMETMAAGLEEEERGLGPDAGRGEGKDGDDGRRLGGGEQEVIGDGGGAGKASLSVWFRTSATARQACDGREETTGARGGVEKSPRRRRAFQEAAVGGSQGCNEPGGATATLPNFHSLNLSHSAPGRTGKSAAVLLQPAGFHFSEPAIDNHPRRHLLGSRSWSLTQLGRLTISVRADGRSWRPARGRPSCSGQCPAATAATAGCPTEPYHEVSLQYIHSQLNSRWVWPPCPAHPDPCWD